MSIWQDANGMLHDDDDGRALALPAWPESGLTLLTDAQVVAARAPTLTQVQAQQVWTCYQAYQTAIAQPVSFTTAGKVTKTFQSDPQSVSNLSAMLSAFSSAGATPSGFYWVAADNTQVPFTYADLQGLAAAMGTQGWAAFQRLQTAKSAIAAASTIAAVQAINF